MRKATLNISTAPHDASFTYHPEELRLLLENETLWEFNGTGYGAFGHQDRFGDGRATQEIEFGDGGGGASKAIRLPLRADVLNASLEMELTGPPELVEVAALCGGGYYSALGYSIDRVGDINGDGREDLAIGAPQDAGGKVYVHAGGQGQFEKPFLTLSAQASYSQFGFSVAGAGDVNGDGFDDIIVGAYAAGTSPYYAGSAYIYHGGKDPDATADVVLKGTAQYDYFGYSVSGAGDINGDGFDDVIVGAPYNSTAAMYSGKACLFLGGSPMDEGPDLQSYGVAYYDMLGCSVSGAGDVNGDGLGDFIVGASADDTNGANAGRAFLYFGGAPPDNATDLVLADSAVADNYGASVSDAGDIDGDGFSDIIVGAPGNDSAGGEAGTAFIYLGGAAPDARPDLILKGDAAGDQFGRAVSGAGDLDADGHDDVVVGAPMNDEGGVNAGKVCAYLGGPKMDGRADAVFLGHDDGDWLGQSVSGAGDPDGDGRDGFCAGGPNNSSKGYMTGCACIYDNVRGLRGARLSVASKEAWSDGWYFNGTAKVAGLAPLISDYLRGAVPTVSDGWGNKLVEVPVCLTCRNDGRAVLGNLSVHYSYSGAVPDFGAALDRHVRARGGEKDAQGRLTVDLTVRSRTPGRVNFSDLAVSIDEAPRLVEEVGDFSIEEDTAVPELVDLYRYFQDDRDPDELLRFTVVSSTHPGEVRVGTFNDQYLSVDAEEGAENDNWTGFVEVVVRCEDRGGSGTLSNAFRVRVVNVNDPPVIVSAPDARVASGSEWSYQVIALDGDADALAYSLDIAPEGMGVGEGGLVTWPRPFRGDHDVALSVSDGQAKATERFRLEVQNQPPRVTSELASTAFVGQPYQCTVTAEDPDGDPVTFSVRSDAAGVTMNPTTGALAWTPTRTGLFEITVKASDGELQGSACFRVEALWPNHAPKFAGRPPERAVVGLPYEAVLSATDMDGDGLNFTLAAGPAGMTLERTGRLSWLPDRAGNYPVGLVVSDGRGGETRLDLTLSVMDPEPPSVVIEGPPGDLEWKGEVRVFGTAAAGSRPVVRVECRLDKGPWREASGSSRWNYTLDISSLAAGHHELEVRAFDGSAHSALEGRGFSVSRPKPELSGGPGTIAVAAAAGTVAAGAAAVLLVHRRLRDR